MSNLTEKTIENLKDEIEHLRKKIWGVENTSEHLHKLIMSELEHFKLNLRQESKERTQKIVERTITLTILIGLSVIFLSLSILLLIYL